MTQDREPGRVGTLDPVNITSLDLVEFHAADDEKVRWTGASSPTVVPAPASRLPSTSRLPPVSGLGATRIPSRRRSSSSGVAESYS